MHERLVKRRHVRRSQLPRGCALPDRRGRASREPLPGRVAVVCAGTSDVPVAEEAAVTAEFHGASVDRVYDVGVAGLHRLLDRTADAARGRRS